MLSYTSGADALADARMRITALAPDQGILFVEGRDDVRLLGPHALALDQLIPCGNKRTLLEAYERLKAGEEATFAFLADCDYDVPAGHLRPAPNLVLTENVDAESDLFHIGITDRIVLELVPAAVSSPGRLASITATVTQRASALAEVVGRFRQVSHVDGLGLSFEKIAYKKYRLPGTAEVDAEKLARTLVQTCRGSCDRSADELVEHAAALPGGPRCIHGHDMMHALAVVLHEDYGVERKHLVALPILVRTCAAQPIMANWKAIQRLRRWETQTGRMVFRI